MNLPTINPYPTYRLRSVWSNKLARISIFFLLILFGVAAFAPLLAPYSPYEMNLGIALSNPSIEHKLGTDDLGRDILSRLIYGSRISLLIGLSVVSIAAGIGVTIGALCGYYGGIIDIVLMRLVDILMAFPFIILVIAIGSLVPPSLSTEIMILGGCTWTEYARVVRGLTLSLREQEYVAAAHALGASDWRIIYCHIIPNCIGPIIVLSTLGIASAILVASALSYLGLGVQPPIAEWGAMLSDSKQYLRYRPLMSIGPGIPIMMTVLAFNTIGDALRDAFDHNRQIP